MADRHDVIDADEPLLIDRRKLDRGWIVGTALIAVVLGLIGLFLPEVSLLTIAILFGSYLIVAGVFRVVAAVMPSRASGLSRWLTGILGGAVIVAGILCLANPFVSLTAVAIAIGIGWLLDGVLQIALVAVRARGTGIGANWPYVLGAIVSIAAGIAMMVLPVTGLRTLTVVGSILLIVLGVVLLTNLPGRIRRQK